MEQELLLTDTEFNIIRSIISEGLVEHTYNLTSKSNKQDVTHIINSSLLLNKIINRGNKESIFVQIYEIGMLEYYVDLLLEKNLEYLEETVCKEEFDLLTAQKIIYNKMLDKIYSL